MFHRFAQVMFNLNRFSIHISDSNRSHLSVNPISEMIPARRNYADVGWATPSAVQLNSAYRDPIPWLDLKDAHFYNWDNTIRDTLTAESIPHNVGLLKLVVYPSMDYTFDRVENRDPAVPSNQHVRR